MTDLDSTLTGHVKEFCTGLLWINSDLRQPLKERAKTLEHRCRGFLECLEGLRLELERRNTNERNHTPINPASPHGGEPARP